MEHQHCVEQRFSWLLCLSPLYPLLYLLNSFLCLFSSCYIDRSLSKYLCIISLKFWPCMVFIECLNACDNSTIIKINCTEYLHAYNRLLNIVII